MSASSLADGVLRATVADLASLSQEARRSLPAVKDAAERALTELRRGSGAGADGSALLAH